jgi:endonuclease/exonuclease/phosphatase (EEP) superfamily protein YafD
MGRNASTKGTGLGMASGHDPGSAVTGERRQNAGKTDSSRGTEHLEVTLSTIGWLMIAATVLPFVRSDHWVVRIFDFPRLQITVVFAVTFAAYVLVREDPSLADNLFLLVLSVCLAYQLWRMWPYTPLHGKQLNRAVQDDQRSLSVLISNVLMTNRDSAKLGDLIREYDPDIVLLVETDEWWLEQLRGLGRTYPHVIEQPQPNTYGMLLYSKVPLVDPQVRFLVQDDVPSIHTGVQLRSGDVVGLHCLHPRPPAPGQNSRSTERDAELLRVAKELEGQDRPSIVVGDMNDVAWSRTNGMFQKISGLLDPRIGRGFYSTFNANWPLIRFPLDHAFVSRHFRLRAFEVLSHVGSDHFPVFASLILSPPEQADANRPPPGASSSEEKEAAEKIARAT